MEAPESQVFARPLRGAAASVASSGGLGGQAAALGSSDDCRAKIRRVIDEQLVRVVFQPIVDLGNGAIFAQEALVRPTSPEFGDPPSLFAAAVAGQCCGELGRT